MLLEIFVGMTFEEKNYFIFRLATQSSLFSLQISKTKYEQKNCQCAPRLAIFFSMCCQFEDLQIILPKVIPMSHHNI